jgi:two-component system, OmpR family, response regulator
MSAAASTQPIRIIVTEDEASLRRDLVDYLNDVGHQAIPAGTARDLELLLKSWQADIIILDINLPDGDGHEIARRIKAQRPVGIIMLTCRGSLEDRVAGLESGADIYLVKRAELREIDAAVRNVHQRLSPRDRQLLRPLAPWLLSGMRLTSPDGVVIPLTAAESAFLRNLMTAYGAAMTRSELRMQGLYPSAETTDRSIDSLVRRVRRKIEQATGKSAPIDKVYGHGYLFADPAELVG